MIQDGADGLRTERADAGDRRPAPTADELTLPRLLEQAAGRFGDKPLLRIGGSTSSYCQVRDMAAGMAGALAAQGVRRGDRVASVCGNRLELMELILGCGWLGATIVPLNTALRGSSLGRVLQAARPSFLLVESDLLDIVTAAGLPPELRAAWLAGPVPGSADPRWQPGPRPGGSEPAPPGDVAPGDTLAILFTSGTTGTPQGVCCPHAQFAWWGATVASVLRITSEDVLHTCLPLFHTNALNAFWQALMTGSCYVLGSRFSASRLWDDLAESGATMTYLLGAMAGMLAVQPPNRSDRAHRCQRALAPASPPGLISAFRERFGVVLVEGFGSTETNLIIGATPEEQRPGYLGRVIGNFDVRVVDETGAPVPDGVPGELITRSKDPLAFAAGYFDNPGRTAEAWRDGWFHTGDRVVRDADGWLRFIDRIRDVIRRRGENISSREVENALASHPDVIAVAAFAVPSELAEDEVMVSVQVKPGSAVSPAELVRHCAGNLPVFAQPRYVDLVASLPTTSNGKVRKTELRAQGVTMSTWDRESV